MASAMPEAAAFGRRQTASPVTVANRPEARPTVFSAADEARRDRIAAASTPVSELAATLDATSGRIQLGGELIAFAGLVLMFLATLIWPDDPLRLDALDGSILIPKAIASSVHFTDPLPMRTLLDASMRHIGIHGFAMNALAFVGITAVLKQRWLLGSLAAMFFVLPWSIFGFEISGRSAILTAFALVAAFQYFKPSRRSLPLVVPLVVLFGPLILGFAFSIVVGLFGSAERPKAEYLTMPMSRLVANEGKPALGKTDSGKPIVRVATLLDLIVPPGEEGALSFVKAQEFALRHDAPGTRQALDALDAAGYRPNVPDQIRLHAIRGYATASGAYGDTAKAELEAHDTRGLIGAWALTLVGIVLGLSGQFAGVIRNRMVERARRISEATEELGRRRAARVPAKAQGARPAGTISFAALDAAEVIEAIASRVRIYQTALLALGGLAILSLAGAWCFWLPAVDSNTAFSKVAVTGGLVSVAEQAGLLPPDVYLVGSAWSLMWWSWPAILLVLFMIFRKSQRLAIGCLAALPLYAFLGPLTFISHSVTDVDAASLGAGLRQVMERSVATAAAPTACAVASSGMITARPLSPDASRPSFKSIGDPPKAEPVIDSSSAAYALAQIAYLEDRPSEMSRLLPLVGCDGVMTARVHRQRLNLMAEWAGANGQAVDTRRSALYPPMSFTRSISHGLLVAAAVLGGLAGLILGLSSVARHRYRRLSDLIDQRRRSEIAVALTS